MAIALSCDQMRELERRAIASGDVTGMQLMERAGRGVVKAVFSQWPTLAKGHHHAVVLCGPGNNGGDGFVIARRLLDRGWRVEVLFWGNADKLSSDARNSYDLYRDMGVITQFSSDAAKVGHRPDLLVDALFGIGITRPIPLELVTAIHLIKAREGDHRCRVVCVDCPSGFDADRGEFVFPDLPDTDDNAELWSNWTDYAQPRIIPADMSITFHALKLGHALSKTGHKATRIVDIGLEEHDTQIIGLIAPLDDVTRLIDVGSESNLRLWFSQCGLIPMAGHKFDRGHALVLAGPSGCGGAARMAARGALRIGAGLVTLGCPSAALIENAAQLNAIMLKTVDIDVELSEILMDQRFSALCLGPALGLGVGTQDLVKTALEAHRPTVLDADALSSFAEDPTALFEQCHDKTILTPHEGEFGRLFPDLGLDMPKVERVKQAAKRAGCIVLLKGAATVIARPDGVSSIHSALYDRAAPQLATAGAGDVLAGFITGLISSPHLTDDSIYRAVECAVWLHVECARQFGTGLIAEDLPDILPEVLQSYGL